MGEEEQQKKTIKQDIIDKHRDKYKKKDESEMTEDEKKDMEALRDLNNGPTSDENRSCTDIICCLFFFLFLGGCVVVTVIGYREGNPNAIMYIYDEDGNACGKAGDKAANFPYLYLYQAVSKASKGDYQFTKQGICVKQCPISYDNTTLNCLQTTNNTNCQVTKENIYLSSPWLSKLCFPSLDLYNQEKERIKNSSNYNSSSTQMDNDYKNTQSLINANFINVDKLFDYLNDLQVVWPIFLACVGIAVVIGFIYLCIIRLCGGCIAYTTIFLILAALAGLGYVFQRRMLIYEAQNDTTYYNIMLAFAIIFYALAFIWLVIIMCSCNRIRLAIALTEVAAIFVWKVMSIILVPIVFFIIVGLYLAYWITLSVFIYSSGEITKSDNTFLGTVKWYSYLN